MSQFPDEQALEAAHVEKPMCFGCQAVAEYEVLTETVSCFSAVSCGPHLGDLLGNVVKVLAKGGECRLIVRTDPV